VCDKPARYTVKYRSLDGEIAVHRCDEHVSSHELRRPELVKHDLKEN
jgi:hypothetical protein